MAKPDMKSALQKVSGRGGADLTENAPLRRSKGDQVAGEPKIVQRPSRAGKSLIGGHFDPEVRKLVKQIALDEDKTVQDLIAEALNMLFVHYGKPEAAPKPN